MTLPAGSGPDDGDPLTGAAAGVLVGLTVKLFAPRKRRVSGVTDACGC